MTDTITHSSDSRNANMPVGKFLTALTDRLNNYKTRNGYTYFDKYEVETELGNKFLRVYAVEVGNQRSNTNRRIVAFVNRDDGNIFKPATYKAPAKHARGNITSPTFGMEAIDDSGHVVYLR